MAQEVFEAVQAAENMADHLLQDAQQRARELIKQTEAEITAQERGITLEHRALYQSILDQKRVSVQDQLAAGREAVLRRQEADLAQARGRLAQASQLVFERVWNDGNR